MQKETLNRIEQHLTDIINTTKSHEKRNRAKAQLEEAITLSLDLTELEADLILLEADIELNQ